MAGFLARRIDSAVRASTRAAMEESGALLGPQLSRAANEVVTTVGPRLRQELKRTKRRAVLGTVGAGAGAGAVMSAPQWVMLERDRRERKEMASMRKSNDDVTVARIAGAVHPVVAGGYGAYKGKKGRKAAVGLRTGGRSLLEGAVGAIPGFAVTGGGALLASRGSRAGLPLLAIGNIGSVLGGVGGSAHGAGAAYRNSVRRGDVVASKSMWRDGVPMSELSKAWRGESGDKRNTKYAGALYGGGLAGSLGTMAAVPRLRRAERIGVARFGRAAEDAHLRGAGFREMASVGRKAQLSTPGIKRAFALRAGSGVGGALAAAGGYGLYRQTERSKRRRGQSVVAAKAMTPRKLAALRRLQSSPSAAGEYSRLRMGNYLRGEGATPMRGARGDAFRDTVRSQSLDNKMKMRFVMRSANNSSVLGRPARPLP